MKKETILSFSFRKCQSNRQHQFCCLVFWAPHCVTRRSVGKYLHQVNKGKYGRNVFASYLFFYLFFLYVSFGTFFGQGIAPASQRWVQKCNQNMESDILRQHSLALSPWLSKGLQTPYWWTPNTWMMNTQDKEDITKKKKKPKKQHTKLETDDFPRGTKKKKKNVNTEINIEMKWTTTFWYKIQPLQHTA